MHKEPQKFFRFHLEELMWGARIKTISELSERTKISRQTLTSMKNGNIKRLHLSTVYTLCTFFDCGIDDLIEIKSRQKLES